MIYFITFPFYIYGILVIFQKCGIDNLFFYMNIPIIILGIIRFIQKLDQTLITI